MKVKLSLVQQRVRAASVACPHIRVGPFDGELVDPRVVVDHVVAGLGGDELAAQHPPGQAEAHHTLHGRGPVAQRNKA